MTAPVCFCCCAHSRGRHQANPFTGQRSGPCKPSCGCTEYRESPVPVTPPVLEFRPRAGEIAAREAG